MDRKCKGIYNNKPCTVKISGNEEYCMTCRLVEKENHEYNEKNKREEVNKKSKLISEAIHKCYREQLVYIEKCIRHVKRSLKSYPPEYIKAMVDLYYYNHDQTMSGLAECCWNVFNRRFAEIIEIIPPNEREVYIRVNNTIVSEMNTIKIIPYTPPNIMYPQDEVDSLINDVDDMHM